MTYKTTSLWCLQSHISHTYNPRACNLSKWSFRMKQCFSGTDWYSFWAEIDWIISAKELTSLDSPIKSLYWSFYKEIRKRWNSYDCVTTKKVSDFKVIRMTPIWKTSVEDMIDETRARMQKVFKSVLIHHGSVLSTISWCVQLGICWKPFFHDTT